MGKLIKLPDDTFNKLVDLLTSTPPTPEIEDLATHIQASVQIPPKELQGILDTIYALHYVREFSDVRPARFVSDLLHALRTSQDPSLGLTEGEAVSARDRFKKLLSIENVSLLAKAMRLQRDGERLYCEAKILSDLRAVFHDDPTAAPVGAVVSHTLKLGYHEKGDHKEFFVVLESADLKALKEVIERAQSKETTLRTLLPKAGLQDLSL